MVNHGPVLNLLILAVCVAGLVACDVVENREEVYQPAPAHEIIRPLVDAAESWFSKQLSWAACLGGFASGELVSIGTFGPLFAKIHRGNFEADNPNIDWMYHRGVTAIATTASVTRQIRESLEEEGLSDPERNRLHVMLARAHLFGGFARVYMAGHFQFTTIEGGPPLQINEIYEQSVDQFTAAVEAARMADDRENETYALAGRARSQLYLDNFQAAAADAAAALELNDRFARRAHIVGQMNIPGPEPNLVYQRFYLDQADVNKDFIVAPDSDPRTQTSDNGIRKYASEDADIMVTKWQEMHLVIAEAAWREGDLGRAVNHINAVRTSGETYTFSGREMARVKFELPPFEIDGTSGAAPAADQVRDQIISERAAEFWLDGMWWQDARRYLGPPFNHPEIVPWPPSAWIEGTDSGQMFPIGATEQRTNPHL